MDIVMCLHYAALYHVPDKANRHHFRHSVQENWFDKIIPKYVMNVTGVIVSLINLDEYNLCWFCFVCYNEI